MKTYKVFKANIAYQLRKMGFWIIGTEPNLKKPWLDVFLFEDTESFREALTLISGKRK